MRKILVPCAANQSKGTPMQYSQVCKYSTDKARYGIQGLYATSDKSISDTAQRYIEKTSIGILYALKTDGS